MSKTFDDLMDTTEKVGQLGCTDYEPETDMVYGWCSDEFYQHELKKYRIDFDVPPSKLSKPHGVIGSVEYFALTQHETNPPGITISLPEDSPYDRDYFHRTFREDGLYKFDSEDVISFLKPFDFEFVCDSCNSTEFNSKQIDGPDGESLCSVSCLNELVNNGS